MAQKEEYDKVEIRYDENSVDYVYVRYQKQLHKIPLCIGRDALQTFKGMTFEDYDVLDEMWKQEQQKQKQKDLERHAGLSAEIRAEVASAKALSDNAPNVTDGIKAARAAEQDRIHHSPLEQRNRLVERFGEPVTSTLPDAQSVDTAGILAQNPEMQETKNSKPDAQSSGKTDPAYIHQQILRIQEKLDAPDLTEQEETDLLAELAQYR